MLSTTTPSCLRNLTRYAKAQATNETNSVPGVVFLQVDGLALAVLQRAVRDGNAPTLAGWLRRGSHRLIGWTTDWSSQTGASQAGILLGSNENMPAFRWLEKDTGMLFVSNRPRHAAAIERRQSTGKGLLHADGASRGNIFTGDAADAVLTMASAGRKHGRIGAGYYAYFSHPYATMHTLLGVLADAAPGGAPGRSPTPPRRPAARTPGWCLSAAAQLHHRADPRRHRRDARG